MQYMVIDQNDTLESISKIVGPQNVDLLLAENSLTRAPKIGRQWKEKCNDVIANTPNNVTGARKSALLNGLTGSQELFEKACLLDEDEWKVFSALQSFPDTLRVPEAIRLPFSSKVIGDTLGDNVVTLGNVAKKSKASQTKTSSGSASSSTAGARVSTTGPSDPVDTVTYRAVMNQLKVSDEIDQSVFNKVNTSLPVSIEKSMQLTATTTPVAYNLPWGKIQMYSSLLDEIMDFPAYPEQIQTGRVANYTQMPDLIYQYEPWISYQSSGPREQSLTFHMHRDMWSGNHLDGRANELIRFCEANTFPRYSGAAVLAPTVRLYVDGALFIAGVMTQSQTTWQGPIGLDNWYLEFELSITIQEVSDFALNIDSVRKIGIIGS